MKTFKEFLNEASDMKSIVSDLDTVAKKYFDSKEYYIDKSTMKDGWINLMAAGEDNLNKTTLRKVSDELIKSLPSHYEVSISSSGLTINK